jgi:succinate-semialdehyde dehydrogenase/glutarate-semialdehyde dehydrogenase
MPIQSLDPATGQVVATFDEHTPEQVDAALDRAVEAFAVMRRTTFAERAGWLRAAADLLEAEADGTARTMTLEMGKTLASARAEVLKCAAGCRHYADHAEEHLADQPRDAAAVGATRAWVRYDPLGPVLAVMPWNFPLWQAVRFAAPALMAGNVGLLKHASNVPQSALYLQSLIERAGFPDGAFQTLLIPASRVAAVIADPRVVATTVTGSGPAGAAVAEASGRALKPTVQELGGSDPYVVMPSADLAAAARVATTARCQNNGQSCIAAKRFIVHADVADEFERLFADHLAALVVGHPADAATDVGPLATEQGRRDVEDLVADARARGARIVVGGEVPDGPGWYYPPTLVTDITPDMRLYAEEVFGPVASLYRVASIDEAIRLANDTEFGLGANAWTNDPGEQDRFVRELEAGMVFVNGMVTSYPALPFGGIKTSGFGRELSELGIRAFCNTKTVWLSDRSGSGSAAPALGGVGAHSE